jgi:integrase
MAALKLTDAFLRGLSVNCRTEILDNQNRGLMIRAYPSGRRVFAFRMRGKTGVIQNAIIGEYPEMKLALARVKAAEMRQILQSGGNVTAAAQKAALVQRETAEANIPTLEQIIEEYAEKVGHRFRIWKKTKRGKASEAEKRIMAVFGARWTARITTLTLQDLSDDMVNYRPLSGASSANGQVSRARAYLSPVLDWVANRKRFRKVGYGRRVLLPVVDLSETHDPASDDDRIKGHRDRSLSQAELAALLPFLVYPAPERLGMMTKPAFDVRPIAIRFLLLTAARLDELVQMRWRDFREAEGNWHKPHVKSRGESRGQTLPLSNAAIALLQSLPGYEDRNPDQVVFPNSEGNPIENWDRITRAIMRESGTSDWHRHDLRRTAATIMEVLEVSERVIDKILAHKLGTKDETVSRALHNYLVPAFTLSFVKDPQRDALDKLAEAYGYIERPQEFPSYPVPTRQ